MLSQQSGSPTRSQIGGYVKGGVISLLERNYDTEIKVGNMFGQCHVENIFGKLQKGYVHCKFYNISCSHPTCRHIVTVFSNVASR